MKINKEQLIKLIQTESNQITIIGSVLCPSDPYLDFLDFIDVEKLCDIKSEIRNSRIDKILNGAVDNPNKLFTIDLTSMGYIEAKKITRDLRDYEGVKIVIFSKTYKTPMGGGVAHIFSGGNSILYVADLAVRILPEEEQECDKNIQIIKSRHHYVDFI